MAGKSHHLPSYNPFALKPLRQKMAVGQQNRKNPSVRTHARDKIRKNLYLRRASQFFDGQNLTDASMETALYTYNMLKRALGTDKYRERICFIRFARNEEQLFFRTKWGYAVTKTNDGREIERSFYKFVISQLSKNFPSQFPVKEKNGKRHLTTFYDLDKIDKERADDYTEDAYDDYDPYGGYGSYENWALQEAYDGDPSNLRNTD